MYTRSIYNFYYQNIGLQDNPIGADRNGRALYGDIATLTSNPAPVRKPIPGSSPAATLGDVIAISNTKTHDYAYNITGQLVKRFSEQLRGTARLHVRPIVQRVGSDVLGRLLQLVLRPIVLGPPGCAGPLSVQVGHAASPRGGRDVHAPNQDRHIDLVDRRVRRPVRVRLQRRHERRQLDGERSRVRPEERPRHDRDSVRCQRRRSPPAAQQDSLENFINGHSCLNSQRGTIMKRNSCRAPWDKVVNLSARQSLPTLHGQNFILQLDVFNFLNLLNKNWGARDFGSTNSPQILQRRGFVAAPRPYVEDG